VEETARIVAQIRERWPGVEIWLRADSGFAREELMAWVRGEWRPITCSGLARNNRLVGKNQSASLAAAEREAAEDRCAGHAASGNFMWSHP